MTPEAAAQAGEVAQRTGFAASRDLQLATGILVAASYGAKLNKQCDRAKAAGHEAVTGSTMLSYAAGVMAEALVMRHMLDPETWDYVSGPWRGIIEIPPLYEGAEPEAVARARATRAKLEAR